jgi:hypothetical protein
LIYLCTNAKAKWLCEGRLRGRMATRGAQRIWIVQMSAAGLDQLRASKNPV